MSRKEGWLLCVILVGAVAAPAAAQEPVTSFQELPAVLKPGNVVFVQDEKGERVKGKITELSGTSLRIMTGVSTGTRTFTADRVSRVSKVDSRLNGFLIGAVAGAVPGLLLGHGFKSWCENESGSHCGNMYAYFGGLLGITGGGIGYAIDGAINGQTLVYRRPSLSVSVKF